MEIGRVEISPVIDGRILGSLPASRPLPEPGSALWEDQQMFHADGRVESTVGAFLVRSGERVALVDAGIGPSLPTGQTSPVIDVDDPDDPVVSELRNSGVPDESIRRIADNSAAMEVARGGLPDSLAALGVSPDDVTDLVFTHLHFDHIGWASVAGSAFFANATVRCASADLDYFLGSPDEDRFTSLIYQTQSAPERLEPVMDRIETWDSDQTLMPGVNVRLTPGHTPGSSVVVVSDGTARALLLGDIIHCPLELQDDDFNFLVDHDPEQAIRVREAYARELEGSDTVAAAAHFPGLRFGRLLPGETTRRWGFEPE